MTWSHLVSQHVNGEYRCTFAHYHFQKQVCSQSDSCWCVIGQSMAPGCSSPNTVCVCVCVCVLFVLLQLPVEWMTVCLLLIKHWVIVHTVGWCLPAGWLQQCVKTNGRFRNDRAVRKWVVDAIWDVSPSVCVGVWASWDGHAGTTVLKLMLLRYRLICLKNEWMGLYHSRLVTAGQWSHTRRNHMCLLCSAIKFLPLFSVLLPTRF